MGEGGGGVCIWDKLCGKMDKIERIWLVRVGGGEGDGCRCPMCGLLLNRRRWGASRGWRSMYFRSIWDKYRIFRILSDIY